MPAMAGRGLSMPCYGWQELWYALTVAGQWPRAAHDINPYMLRITLVTRNPCATHTTNTFSEFYTNRSIKDCSTWGPAPSYVLPVLLIVVCPA